MFKNSNALMSSIVTISWFIYTVYQNYPMQFTVLERHSTDAEFYIKKILTFQNLLFDLLLKHISIWMLNFHWKHWIFRLQNAELGK